MNKDIFKKIIKPLTLISVGGFIYLMIEFLFRGYSHWTMFIVGGLCFYFIGLINEIIPYNTPIWKQAIIGGVLITIIEFISGCVLNLWLKWDIWDYSDLPFNILGQVCLLFTFLWCLLSIVGIVLDDYLRYWLFNGDKPHYVWK